MDASHPVMIAIMAVAYYGFETRNVPLLMVMVFISGTHSTFAGPIKYSILPEHLRTGEWLAGNGFVASGTYLGVLAGLIAGGLLVVLEGNIIGKAALAVAGAGFAASLFIPRTRPAHPEMKMNWHLLRGTLHIVDCVRGSKPRRSTSRRAR